VRTDVSAVTTQPLFKSVLYGEDTERGDLRD
jgi:hypothetical protein